MTLILSDRVKETTTTAGTGSITLTGAFGGFRSFSQAIGNGNSTYYVIENDAQFEIGIGTYTLASNSLSRDTVLQSSDGGSKITLSGVSTVFVTYPAEKSVHLGTDGKLSLASTNTSVSGLDVFSLDATSHVGVSGLLTLRRSSAGNFFHAYVDDSNDKTISLHHDATVSPDWKLGFKDSPSDVTAAPSYAYIYAGDGSIGLYSNSQNSVNLTHGGGFNIVNKGNTVFSAYSNTGVSINSASASNPTLIVKATNLQSADLQRWIDSSSNVLAKIEDDGSISANTITTTGNLFIGSTNVLSHIGENSSSGVAISGWARYYSDSQDHTGAQVSGALQPQITQNASDINVVSGIASVSIDAMPHSSGDFFLGEIQTNSASGASNSSDILVVSGIAASASAGLPAASGGKITENTNLINASGDFLLGEITTNSASGASISGYAVGYTNAKITALIDGAPAALDTLHEIADALNDDANLAGTLTTSITNNTNLVNGLDIFNRVSVAGQDHILAATTGDTLTFVEGSNVTITTNASEDKVTFSAPNLMSNTSGNFLLNEVRANSASGAVISGIAAAGGSSLPQSSGDFFLTEIRTNSSSGNFNLSEIRSNSASGAANLVEIRANSASGVTNANAINNSGVYWLGEIRSNSASGAANLTEIRANSASGNFNLTEIRANSASGNFNLTEIRANSASGAANLTEIRANSASGVTNANAINNSGVYWLGEIRTNSASGNFNLTEIRANSASGVVISGIANSNSTNITSNTSLVNASGDFLLNEIRTNSASGTANLTEIRANSASGNFNLTEIRTNSASGNFNLTEIRANSASGAVNAADILVVSGIAAGGGGGGMTAFILEDDSGDEVSISNNEEVKFIGAGGLTINWTDTSDGSDGDPFDLTFTIGTLNQNTTGSAATLTTARAIALAGDVTGTANFDGSAGISITSTIANDAVTYAKMQDTSADNRLLGAATAGTIGEVQVATAMIADDAVTYAKIQNVSATDRILGRDSSGAGVIEEITPANLRTMINVEDGATADQTKSDIDSLAITTVGTLAAGDATAIVSAASTTAAGKVELATTAETTTGTDTARAVTPDGLKDGYQGSTNVTTLGTIATGTWQGTAIAHAYIGDDAIDGDNIADDSINSEHYVDGSIDTAHIDDDQVTYAKVQNVSATSRVLGRITSGAGVIEELTGANIRTIANVADGADVTSFVLEDDSGDEVTITKDKEVKFIGAGGLTINWTDTDNGTDADPYDLTFTIGTLNQNTTGSAATLTTAREINGVAFDGSANITVTAAGTTLSDTVPVSKGGTGATSFADKSVLITQDTGTDTVAAAAMSSNGQLLIGGTSGPAVATLTEGSNITITNADGAITIAAAGGGSSRSVAGDTDNGVMTWVTSDNTFAAEANLTFDGSTLTLAGVADITDTTDASDATGDTGALRCEGGASIAKKLYVGTDLDVGGTTNLDAVDIDGNVQLDGTLTVGVNDTGKDVKFYGATAGSYLEWDESEDRLNLVGAAYVNEAVPANDTATTATATITIDASLGNYHNIVIGSSQVRTININNAKRGQKIILRLTQHAGSAQTVTAWLNTGSDFVYYTGTTRATLRWAGNIKPTMSTSTGHTDVYGFLCTDNAGSKFDAFIIGQDLPD